jgi:hypothetical protein
MREGVHANPSNERIKQIVPIKINGRRRPQREVQWSLHIPRMGCTSIPERGPARKAIAVWDLERPRERRCVCCFDVLVWVTLLILLGKRS